MKFKEFIDLDYNNKFYGLDIAMAEAIIRPENIKVNKVDINYLQNKFPDIEFTLGDDLQGGYDAINDKIHITFNYTNTKDELQAMIGHESIHRIQNKKSNGKYLEQSLTLIRKINNLGKNIKSSEDEKEYDKIYSEFVYGSSQEKMTYAYQFVKLRNDKEYNFKNPSDIIHYIELFNSKSSIKYTIDNKMKKYIGMYWLIRDKI